MTTAILKQPPVRDFIYFSVMIANGSGLRLEYRMSKTGTGKSIKLLSRSQADNPFFQFKVSEPRGKRDKLSIEDLQAIEDLDLEGGSLIWHVRNYFLFSFYCAGVRFGDMAKMKRSNVVANGSGPRLEYQMSKTGNGKSLKLLPQART